MDIDLFSDIVKDLILDNDEVTLPGLGSFVCEVMPSTFSDKGYTINPPYRHLSFRQRWNPFDTLLRDFYAITNGIDEDDAQKIISDFIDGLKETLKIKKLIVIPGLGRLRATKENVFFFIQDEDLDIYPYGYGLEPVSLKTHEETPEEVTAAVQELREIVEAPVSREPVHTHKKRKKRRNSVEARPWILALMGIIVVAIVFFGIFILLAHIAPDFIDSLLYSEEELRIINY